MRTFDRNTVKRLCEKRDCTPTTIQTSLETNHPDNPLAAQPMAIKKMKQRMLCQLRGGVGVPQFESIHKAMATPTASLSASRVTCYWPVQNSAVTDKNDPRGHFAVIVMMDGVEPDVVKWGRHGIGLDAAVSMSSTGIMLKLYVMGAPVRPTTAAVPAGNPMPDHLLLDGHNRPVLEGAPRHHRRVIVAGMLHNVEVHPVEIQAIHVISGVIPCSRPGCNHPITVHWYTSNPEAWYRERTECRRHLQLSHLIWFKTDLSSPQLKALYTLSPHCLNVAHSTFTGSGRQWTL